MTMYVDETPFKIVNVMLNITYYEKNNENKIWQILKLRYVQNVAMFKKKKKKLILQVEVGKDSESQKLLPRKMFMSLILRVAK